MNNFYKTMNNLYLPENKIKMGQLNLFFLFILLVFILTSCPDSIIKSHQDNITEEKGWFSLVINESDKVGRTILPKTVQNDFAMYTLEFFNAGTNTYAIPPIDRTNANLSTPVLLDAGSYDLYVYAFMDSEKTRIAASGELKNIVIGAGVTVTRSVLFSPIFDGVGKGTFNWDISYPINVVNASITIIRLPTNSENLNQIIPITGTASQNGSIELFSGFYRVVVKLKNDKDMIAERWETLHIYQNMESDFAYTFKENHFNGALTGTVSINGNPYVGETLTADIASLGGSGVITFQWMRSGVIINGANSNTYTIQPADAGAVITLTVSRSDYSGFVTSVPTVEVSYLAVITITTQPINKNFGDISGSIIVEATVSQNAIISYQWYSNTINSYTGGTIINGATNTSYSIPTSLKKGTYYYYCEVSATGGAIPVLSNIAMVNIDFAVLARALALNGSSSYDSIAVDSSGDIYAVGRFSGGNSGPLLVKYHSDGTYLWNQIVQINVGTVNFNSITIDTASNLYIVGSMYSVGGMYGSTVAKDLNFGNGVTIASGGGGAMLVKYNLFGMAQWARTISGSPGHYSGIEPSSFSSVTIDSSGNLYALGSQGGYWIYSYGNGVTAQGQGTSKEDGNTVLVKYNSNGYAQWAKILNSGSNFPNFHSITIDASGNLYIIGFQKGTDIHDYGNGVTAQGTCVWTTNSYGFNISGFNATLVKYNSDGIAQWARTISSGTQNSSFSSVIIDSSGNLYAVGYQDGTDIYDYGNGVTAQGTSGGANALLVKYSSDGVTQWARTISSGTQNSSFSSVIIDSSGNLYAVGTQRGTDIYDYGNGVTAQGTSGGTNALLVKYSSDGVTQWARTISSGTQNSSFSSVTINSSGNLYAVGTQRGTDIYDYGNGVTAQGTNNGSNAVLVMYRQE